VLGLEGREVRLTREDGRGRTVLGERLAAVRLGDGLDLATEELEELGERGEAEVQLDAA